MNLNILSEYNLFLIDYQYNIILKSRDYDNKIKHDINNYFVDPHSKLTHL